ncbi:hypothetical protein [Neptunomonas antarctica]|uniref:Uncharacterized protein n=1 Tax=Neptunomonas antarctica TaxID=619304 RepID=A0A1N7JEL7_9GAMM|nr:hypothetical protein [Neptunomonas antarctica]SIS47777.1 hypothetical protein SAMN05421760_1011036 [Neptunomonas antarctica]
MNLVKTARELYEVHKDKQNVITPKDDLVHLKSAMDWLVRAHDVTADNGVAQTYLTKYKKWANSYPETTGYIIPTFYRYYQMTGDDNYKSRAIKMADWECDIQLDSGGVLAGAMGDSELPTVFNTGQVLFGWATAYESEQNERYLNSLNRASDWLCDIMDDDGCWRQFGSPMTLTDGVNLYNTRTAWGLIRAHQISGNSRYLESACKNLEWALSNCSDNGFAEFNCLQDRTQPFLHTIAYAMRGFLEIGEYAGRKDFLDQAILMGDALLPHVGVNGHIPGRFDKDWKPTVKWACLTGNAQISINWCRLYQITGETKYLKAARAVMDFTKSTQLIDSENIDIRGGIKGSHPINGGYHPWQYPNWATKFFADALMILITIESGEGPYSQK